MKENKNGGDMKALFLSIIAGSLILALSGCERVSAPYIMKTDRQDQNLAAGNRGYFKGTPPPPEDRGDLKREFIAVDIDLIDVNKSRKTSLS